MKHSIWPALLLPLSLAGFAFPVTPGQQTEAVPGNAARGAVLFEQKGCVRCHSFNGRGGTAAA